MGTRMRTETGINHKHSSLITLERGKVMKTRLFTVFALFVSVALLVSLTPARVQPAEVRATTGTSAALRNAVTWSLDGDLVSHNYNGGNGWDIPVNVSGNSDISRYPSLLVDPQGSAHVVWQDHSPGIPTIMYATKPPNGVWSVPVSLPDAPNGLTPVCGGGSSALLLIIDLNDSLHAFWQACNDVEQVVEIVHSQKPGAEWSPPEIVSDDPTHSEWGFFAAVDGINILHLVWNHCDDEGYGTCLIFHESLYYAQKLPGTAWSAPRQIAPARYRIETFNYLGKSSLIVDADDTVHLIGDYGNGNAIFYMYKPSGSQWSSPEIIPGSHRLSRSPSMAISDLGIVHVSWLCYPSGICYANRQDGVWSSATNISGSYGGNGPHVALDHQENVHVVWSHASVGNYGVGYNMRTAAGVWLTPTIVLTNTPSGGCPRDLLVDNNDTLHLAVQAMPLNDLSTDIWYMVKLLGSSWSSPVNLSNSPGIDSDDEELRIAPDGRIHVLWREGWFSGETTEIYHTSCLQNCTGGGPGPTPTPSPTPTPTLTPTPSPTPTPTPCELSKQPVLFVHGWHGGAESLQEDEQLNFFIDYFGEGYEENCNLWYAQGVSEDNRLHQNAERIQATLRQAYDYISAHNPSFDGHFDVIAHSMGGVNSRAYLESELYQDDQKYKGGIYIDNFFTLGTPHGGAGDVPIALFYGILRLKEDWPSIKELLAPHMLWFNLQHSQPEGVCYRLLGGNVNVQHPYLALFWLVPNDLLASQSSAHALVYPPFSSKWPRMVQEYTPDMHGYHPSLSSWRSYVRPRTTFDNYIKGFLGSTSCLGSSAMALEVTTPITESTSFRMTPFVSGVITTGQSLTGTLAIDSDGHTGFYLVWYEGDLDFTLVAPDGTVMDTTTAEIDPNVSFLALDALLSTEMYVVTDTLSGTWTFTATAVSLPYPMPYAVYAVLDTPINLALSTAEWYPKGSAAVITATLRYSSTALTGASMQAEVSRPDGVTETIALLDDGNHNDGLANDGVYGNSYTRTDVGGYYGAIATASGNYLGQDYQRAAQTIFTVSPGTASLSGAYSDQGEDADNNGLYEYLILHVGLDLTQAGHYSLAAVLEGPGGQYIDHAMKDITLGVGPQIVTLRFDGDAIRNSGLDGPYTVTQVLLTDNSKVAVKLDEAHDVWATAAYDHRQFGSGWRLYLSLILRNG